MPVHLTINPADPDLVALAPALEALRRGGVIAYPTDTLYALGADPRDADAIARVFLIKGRSEQHAIPLIAGNTEQAREVATFGPMAARLAQRFWPGPLTLVLSRRIELTAGAGQHGTVAVRVPDHAVARALALGLGFPITSTSANRTGAPAAETAPDLVEIIGNQLDVIVDGGRTRGGPPSTIVDVSGAAPRLLRAGAVAWDRVLESLE